MTYYERNLPHWHPAGRSIFITWRLFGSVPRTALTNIKNAHANAPRRFLATQELLDRALSGPHWLADPAIAGPVEKAFKRGEELGQYELQAWVIMPNHVHALLAPSASLKVITKGIKGVTAREANAILGRIGKPFWQDESFDRWVRDSAGFERVRTYIENNPVKAGLAKRAEDWRWSSAGNAQSRANAQ